MVGLALSFRHHSKVKHILEYALPSLRILHPVPTNCRYDPKKSILPKPSTCPNLLRGICSLIEESRTNVTRIFNAALEWLYWNIGKRIREDILQSERAGYWEEIVVTVSRQLMAEFGKGFSKSNHTRMLKLAEYYPNQQIVVTLSQRLSWSHFLAILPMEDPLKRDFYSVRITRQRLEDSRAG